MFEETQTNKPGLPCLQVTRGSFVKTNKTLARLFEVLASYFRSSLSQELEMSKTTNIPAQMLHMTNRVDLRDQGRTQPETRLSHSAWHP